MWVKVDDGLPDHAKVQEAGRQLGQAGAGRVVAMWTVGMCYCNRTLSDGKITEPIIRTWTLFDKRPLDVFVAMAVPMPNGDNGLVIAVPDGFQFHDYDHYQPLSTDVKAKRKKDRDRKRLAKQEADGILAGIPELSARNPERSCARDPDPVPVQEERTEVHRGWRRDPVVNLKVLKALVWRETQAAYQDPGEDFTIASVSERLKLVAARAGLIYSQDLFHEQIELAVAKVPQQRMRRSA